MNPLELGFTSFAALLLLSFLLWLFSLRRQNVTVVDVFWGPAFGVVAGVGAAFGAGPVERRLLVFGLVALWGLRLAAHLAMRSHGKPEDHRYAAMRKARGPSFAWKSLFIVFWFQALLASVIALPIHAAAGQVTSLGVGVLDLVAASVVLIGLAIEATADLQLTRFGRDPANKGKVLDTGLWRYSRHPNYFGDAVVWWGLGLFGLATGAWFTVLGPTLMTLLLLKVSGVTLLEKTIGHRRPAYAEYARRTSPFVPWPPRS